MQSISVSRGEHVRRYGLAILAAIAALSLRKLLAPVYGEHNPYHTAWAALVFSAWYCGVGPSIVTVFVELMGIWYWFLAPFNSIELANFKPDIFGMLGFLMFSGFIIALGEANRRSLARSKWAEEQLRISHTELEKKVEGRTAALNAANESLHELSARLQQMRDEEHRLIARELHDSVGQMLAALSMNFAVVQAQSTKLDTAAARAVSDSAALVDQISKEIRTISHLLHPPLLEIAGLASALRWYADGFSERSRIKVDLQIPDQLPRLPGEIEIAIFRMVQECLTNIHRHSGAATATLTIHQESGRILVQVKDAGKGMPFEQQVALTSSGRAGVGFRGMRERLRQLGGNLDIQSDGNGTLVTAALPLQPASDGGMASEKAS